MIKVKDTYISPENIKKIHFDSTCGDYGYIYITYFYDELNPIKICIDDFNEYEELCRHICRELEIIAARRSK